MKEVCCPIHPLTKLICPRCIAAKGGSTTARKYGSKQLSRWGSRGGRPKKKARKRKSQRAGKRDRV